MLSWFRSKKQNQEMWLTDESASRVIEHKTKRIDELQERIRILNLENHRLKVVVNQIRAAAANLDDVTRRAYGREN